MANTTKKEYTIDATGKKLGRVATQAALMLRGKMEASFVPHELPEVYVHITNASKISIDAKKLNKEYARYTGYPGGILKEKRGRFIERKGYKALFEKTIQGMLSRNRTRGEIMKHLTVSE